ncbi:MAG: tyrosine--tRNA ligase [Gammaproteobacteria bacterium]|nr:tyrosine--tRNA ligase [Gammaproteobacteria bacterium]|tara:strand:- start:955 stop:2247 length:1293 start_codon:yes stop_codon:yes gene_type:complete
MSEVASLLEELRQRELLAQVSDEAALEAHLESGSRTVYCGFDPTADSLHIGNLVPLITLRRFQRRGHRPILLIGGATGMIGDPSGRSAERNLNTADTVSGWVDRIRGQVEGLVAFGARADADSSAVIVNNLDWTADLTVIDFLREIGKHFSVNQMIQRDSVRSRLEREGEGISYTEFSYMLLQANDYAELAGRYGCSVQIGGSDQWGNIVSGMDLVRRKLGRESFALTLPLITRADGSKFGKTAEGTVWLDARRTSPYAFYQFWLNTADADAVRFLKIFTFLELGEVASIAAEAQEAPERRLAQRRLAEEVTTLVHGPDGLASAERITAALFDGDLAGLSESDLDQLAQDGMGCTDVADAEIGLLAALADSGLAKSRGEARKLVAGNGIRVNGAVQSDVERALDWQDALHGRFYLLRKGKKNWHMLRRTA